MVFYHFFTHFYHYFCILFIQLDVKILIINHCFLLILKGVPFETNAKKDNVLRTGVEPVTLALLAPRSNQLS